MPPRDSVVLEIDWGYNIPQVGAGGRMGWNSDDFFFLAYWYPQVAVYDDVGTGILNQMLEVREGLFNGSP